MSPILGAVQENGTNVWAFQFHPEVWFMMAMLTGGYLYMVRAIGPKVVPPGQPVLSRANKVAFVLGMALLWFATDWPMHDISEDYLYSVHMVQHMAISYFVPPLALIATPTWLARLLIGNGHLYRVVKWFTQPLVAALLFNGVVILTHMPVMVESAVNSGASHYLQHLFLVAASLMMWSAVCGPIPEFRLSPGGSMIYLFAQSIVPTVPAAWLTFANTPVYDVYDRPVRAFGISLVDDQQLAGAIMKLMGGMFLWAVIIYIFFTKFAGRHREDDDYRPGSNLPDAEIVGHDDVRLTTAEVERAFAATRPAPDESTPTASPNP